MDSRLSTIAGALSPDALADLAQDVVKQMAKARNAAHSGDSAHPDDTDIQRLCDALLSGDSTLALDRMVALQVQGLTLDVLYARYLAEAAVRLGQMWDENAIGFVQVTTAAWRILDVVHALRDRLPMPIITHEAPVLFALVPGERHAVGVEMAAELFRQHGWDVEVMVGACHEQIMDRVEDMACLVLGLSSGGAASLEALTRLINAVRLAHPSIYIIVSGQVVTERPDLVEVLAPDRAVATVEDALATMKELTGEGL